MPKETKFHGILAVGRTKADAVNNYRLLAMNKGATVQVDSDRQIAFIAQASSADGMFNPMSGNMDLEQDEKFIEQLEFNSNSSAEHEVNHLVCKSGCLAHVVFDSESLVKFCPHCTSSLSDDDSDESEDDELPEDESSEEGDSESTDEEDSDGEPEGDDDESESEEGDDSEESDDSDEDSDGDDSDEDGDDSDESDDSEEDSDEDSKDKEPKAEEHNDELPEFTEDDGAVVISSGADDGNIVAVASSFDEAADLFRKHQPQKSLSSAKDGMIEATYLVCSSAECGAHILASDSVDECPACHSDVVEPESNPTEVVAAEQCNSDDESSEEEGEDDSTLELANDDGSVLEEDTEELDAMNDMDQDEEGEEESDSSAKLDVSYSSSVAGQARWTAFYKGVPIAMASKSSVGQNADMFDTPKFGHAVLATAKVSGVRKALKELGFSAIKHSVSVSKVVRNMVEKQVADKQLAIASEQQEFKDRFLAALATAAVGLNRGFFVDQKNPIKGSMWNAMSAAGIRNPESLIDSAFKSHSDAYHKTLFALASDLVAKPAEVQESLSKAIHGIQYQEVSTSSSSSSLEGRLETFGTSVSSEVVVKDQPAASVAVDRSVIKTAVSSLGRGR